MMQKNISVKYNMGWSSFRIICMKILAVEQEYYGVLSFLFHTNFSYLASCLN